jgi:hypothetical protein
MAILGDDWTDFRAGRYPPPQAFFEDIAAPSFGDRREILMEPDANGWMLIDTAPEDGTRVLFYDKRKGMREGNQPKDHPPGNWKFTRLSPRKAWWTGHEFDDRYEPTHWRPLPEPPVETQHP